MKREILIQLIGQYRLETAIMARCVAEVDSNQLEVIAADIVFVKRESYVYFFYALRKL